MQIISPEHLVQFKNLLQSELFPLLESSLGPLSKQSQLLASVLSLEPLARHVKERRAHTGRRPCNRLCLATAFLAKAIYNLPTTRLVARSGATARLCTENRRSKPRLRG